MKYSIYILISFSVLIFSACQSAAERSGSDEPESSVGLLQHNVYFYLNSDVTEEEREQFEKGLQKLVAIDVIYKAEIGVPASTEERDVTDHSFGYSIFTWFESLEDYEVYADHPDHLEFIDAYNHLWADVKVYDSEITSEL